MIKLLRSLFGLNGVTGNRKVVGSPESIEARDVPYIRESNQRLVALQELYGRYKNTPYAQQLQAAYEKTRRIHTYLSARGRGHELELFHVQHTDHFLSTFSAIMDAHQEPQVHVQLPPQRIPQPQPAGRPDVLGRTVVFGPFRSDRKEVKAARTLNRETSQRAFQDIAESRTEVPRLDLPEISINTYSKIVYLREDVSDGLTTSEIGFTSTPEEKEAFVNYITARLGLHDLTYAGNAMVYVPTHDSKHPAEMLPVLHWHGCPYVLSMDELRLYPVRTYRKRR
ncbi:hypothetical protein [Pontibacter flavimaris]|uniref:Uncharacterized protein n=1 Tax=Pontibacter flavimaris TaxID=1797110 RepID=A0A1Q5P8T7_9BACT|nr:hypothetical protein [Pontibacter flavimaris]OKL38552.1 hypothetical protein A3841_05200 [Pontibacter flavimaris]